MLKEKKRDLKLVIYPSVLQKFKAIAHLKGLSLSKLLEYFINREMVELNNPYQLYQHYKNQKLYRILNEGFDEETGDRMVSYQCVNEQNADIYYQPKERFLGLTETGIKRFTPLNPVNIKGIKLYNCVSDRLIEIFDKYEEQNEETDSFDLQTLNKIVLLGTFPLKKLVGTSTTIQEDIEARKQKGLQDYGTYLTPFNGRNALQDAYEEHLDLLHYLYQKQLETEQEEQISLSHSS